MLPTEALGNIVFVSSSFRWLLVHHSSLPPGSLSSSCSVCASLLCVAHLGHAIGFRLHLDTLGQSLHLRSHNYICKGCLLK